MSRRRIIIPPNGSPPPPRRKDPKRQEAARKAHATMAAERPGRLQAELARLTLAIAAAEDRLARACNRWQKLKARIKTLKQRLADL